MSKFLYKLLLILVSLSFYLSATETDIGTCKNTFFDDHDSYVRTESVSFEQVVIDRYVLHSSFLIESNSYSFQQPVGQNFLQDSRSIDFFDHPPPKLFIRNSVLII